MGGLMIAGSSSGAGKTTVSIGIMGALKKKKMDVRPFKVGPDYIDPGFHRFVCGKPSHNLDGYMLNEDMVRYLYHHYGEAGDMSIVEGVMGLYDGYGRKSIGSAAHISKMLDIPVVLVIDGSGVSTSAAATVLGFKNYDPSVNLAGVIVNKVSGEPHYQLVKEAIEEKTGIPCVGYLKKNPDLNLGSRHLGLVPAGEAAGLTRKVDILSAQVAETIDLEALKRLSDAKPAGKKDMPEVLARFIDENSKDFKGRTIAYAYSDAFNFYYQSGLDLLGDLGVELVPMDPALDQSLPEGTDACYFGGGFPEMFLGELGENLDFLKDVRQKLEAGLPCYGECGGFMYLTRSITDLKGDTRDVVGFFDAEAKMTKRLQRFGYVDVEYQDLSIPCHEFHRSLVEEGNLEYVYKVSKTKDGELVREYRCGANKSRTLGGYPHVHFLADPNFVRKVFI
jgi:cobyrinic acid a,c-diamide synthase